MDFQNDWKWCFACRQLCFTRNGGGACIGNGRNAHTFTDSRNFSLLQHVPEGAAPGQFGWRFCSNCKALCFARDGHLPGECPVGNGNHLFLEEHGEYVVQVSQPGWRHCSNCHGMVWPIPVLGIGAGPCPSPHAPTGVHNLQGDYSIIISRG